MRREDAQYTFLPYCIGKHDDYIINAAPFVCLTFCGAYLSISQKCWTNGTTLQHWMHLKGQVEITAKCWGKAKQKHQQKLFNRRQKKKCSIAFDWLNESWWSRLCFQHSYRKHARWFIATVKKHTSNTNETRLVWAKLGGCLPVSGFVVTAMQTIYKYDWNLTTQKLAIQPRSAWIDVFTKLKLYLWGENVIV